MRLFTLYLHSVSRKRSLSKAANAKVTDNNTGVILFIRSHNFPCASNNIHVFSDTLSL